MLPTDKIGLWLIGILFVALALAFAIQISSTSRLRRRRRKSHSRVISKHKGPSVRLTVKPPKD
jgi:hypothetical protein